MRYPDGSLIGDLNDDSFATSSRSVGTPPILSDFDENDTSYDLLPLIVNRPPVITKTVVEHSTPLIKNIDLTSGFGNELYINADGIVRVLVDSSITLRFEARQPSVANVENGLLQVIPNQTGVSYVWRKDGSPLTSFSLPYRGSETSVAGNELTIRGIQQQHNGVYACDASNDIGTTTSEEITIEVVDPYTNQFFFRNLIQNPNGKDGTQNWNSNNNKFSTRQFTTVANTDLKRPNRVDLFGYNSDMLHPRPYQIEPGPMRGIDLSNTLTNTEGTYFTRGPYQYTADGEPHYVRAYQDIDLSDIVDIIKGGVYGVNGVRAVFGCYIGNAITSYIPTKDNVAADKRLLPVNYYSGAPRLSLENFLTAGPSKIEEEAFVTVEEFQDETRLQSRLLDNNGQSIAVNGVITLRDPWNWSDLRGAYWDSNAQYYSEDVYQLGTTSPGRTSFDTDLAAADVLMPDPKERFTYGQYAKFYKIVLDKLNPKTNKIRISLHFRNRLGMLDATWSKELATGDPIELPSYQKLHKKNTFSNEEQTIWDYINKPEFLNLEGKQPKEKYIYLQSPRPMITGVTLGLLPIFRDNAFQTAAQTANTFALNDTPPGYVPDVLSIRPFDPFGKNRRDVLIRFSHRSSVDGSTITGGESLAGIDEEQYQDTTFAYSKIINPSLPEEAPTILAGNLFPFVLGITASFASNTIINVQTLRESLRKYSLFANSIGAGVTPEPENYNSVRAALHNRLATYNLATNVQNPGSQTAANFDFGNLIWTAAYGTGRTKAWDEEVLETTNATWENRARFICHYSRRTLGTTSVTSSLESISIPDTPVIPTQGNSYYVEVDFTNPQAPSAIIWRDDTLPGYASQSLVGPYQMETGFTADSAGALYFKLPQQITSASLANGGLQLSSTTTLDFALNYESVPVSGGAAITELINRSEEFKFFVQTFGSQMGERIIANVFPNASDFYVEPVLIESFAFKANVEFYRRALYDFLMSPSASLSSAVSVPYKLDRSITSNSSVNQSIVDGTSLITYQSLLSGSINCYGESGTQLFMARSFGTLLTGFNPANVQAGTFVVCPRNQYLGNPQDNAQRKIIYATRFNNLPRSFDQSGNYPLIGQAQTNPNASLTTVDGDKTFTYKVIADPLGASIVASSSIQLGSGTVNPSYNLISLTDGVFVSGNVYLPFPAPSVLTLSDNTRTPNDSVTGSLVRVQTRTAASSLYAMEVASFSPTPNIGAFNLPTSSVYLASESVALPLREVFTTSSCGTPVFALGSNGLYYYTRFTTILDQQISFNSPASTQADAPF